MAQCFKYEKWKDFFILKVSRVKISAVTTRMIGNSCRLQLWAWKMYQKCTKLLGQFK